MSQHLASHLFGQTKPAQAHWRNQLNRVAQAMHSDLQLAERQAAVNLQLPLRHIMEGEHALLYSLLDAMFTQVKTRYPNARADYWPTAVWRQMIWQPVYMSIAAVHGLGDALPTGHLAFTLTEELRSTPSTDMRLRIVACPPNTYVPATDSANRMRPDCCTLAITAASFTPFIDQLLQAFNRYEKSQHHNTQRQTSSGTHAKTTEPNKNLEKIPKINRPNSLGLVADTFIFGLKAFAEARGLDDHWLAKNSRRWCLAAGLIDRKGNPISYWQPQKVRTDFSYRFNNTHASEQPLLGGKLMRRACCKDFLVSGETCASCPLNKSVTKGLHAAPFSHSSTAEYFYHPAT